MGMYDSFLISFPLPLEKWIPDEIKPEIEETFKGDGFQSKDLDCILNSYYISNDGHIYLDEFTDFKNDPPYKRKQIYFHGHLEVYTPVFLDKKNRDKMLWFQYDLKFTDSLLVKATMTSPTKEQIDELYGSL